MDENQLRLYLVTSVFGGYFDLEFQKESIRLISGIVHEKFIYLISEIVINEIQDAPMHIQELFASLSRYNLELVPLSSEVIALRNAYLSVGVLGPRWLDDATHVALATAARADALISWNFRHLVRLDKIKAFNQVNFQQNYGLIQILSPREVFFDE